MTKPRTSNFGPRATSPGASSRKTTHGGRRPGAGAPKNNINALKHGLCSEKYDHRLFQASRANKCAVLAHMRDLVQIYHRAELSRRERERLIQQAGLAVLTTWYGLCHAIQTESLLVEQSR